jgi:putative ABC transport system permease protein
MRYLVKLAWQDLSASGHTLWVFCACLALGVTLVAATGGLYQQVSDGLLTDTRKLTGGDLEVDARSPLPEDALNWIRQTGDVSLLTELDSMMGTDAGFQIVELQSVDANYPLYGELQLLPEILLTDATSFRDGVWGIAVDPILAERLSLNPGDTVDIGNLEMEVRAVIEQQPDRALNADWRGAPVLISADALKETGLILPTSRVDYEYRVRTNRDPDAWEEEFFAKFPNGDWEVRSFMQQSDRIAERLGQVASGLLIIGFSTLFIGGLGVFNSVQAYLQGKLGTIATLRAIGLRDRRLAIVYLLQICMLASLACLAGALAGFAISLIGAAFAATQVQVATAATSAIVPALMAAVFGLITALTFSFPAIGRALSVDPAELFRNIDGAKTETPKRWWLATIAGGALIILLVLFVLPDPLFALIFIGVVLGLLLLLEGIVRGLRKAALALEGSEIIHRRFALRLAVANLHRNGSALRTSLLSLGSALTLLVACATVVAALIQTISSTIPEESPALVMYDIAAHQRESVVGALNDSGASRVDMAPLVQGRLARIDGTSLAASSEIELRREARDDHKLTYATNNIDGVNMIRGSWWGDGPHEVPKVVFEDREADQLGLEVGDLLEFSIEGRSFDAELTGIYSQQGMQTRFWFEGIVSDGALDDHISRYVGAAYMTPEQAITAQAAIQAEAPNVVSIRTATMLETATELLGKALIGLALVAGVALLVSLLVLTGVMATNRARQVYDATVLHSLGARISVIRQSLNMEYVLLACVTSTFAIVLGTAIAVPLMVIQLKLPLDFPIWPGFVTAFGVSGICLYVGARYLLQRLTIRPAMLLRGNG